MKFETVQAELNGFGRFQLRVILMLVPSRVSLCFNFLLSNFIAAVPSHHCDVGALDEGSAFRNLSRLERLAVRVPLQDDGTPSSCQMFAEPQYQRLVNSSDAGEIPTVSCVSGWVYDHTTFESTLATEWDLVCEKKSLNRATATIFFIGVMLGAAVFGFLSDRIGRKKTLLVSYLTTTFFGLASALSYNWAMFAVMRFFTGFGISGVSIITYVLAVEWVDTKHRALAGVLMSLDWSLSSCLLSPVAYFVNSWRYLTAVSVAPVFLSMVCWWWLPESARWLMSNGKTSQAHFYLSMCAKVNRREEFMADIKPETLADMRLAENDNRKYSFLDLVRTPRMRKITLLTCFVWFGVACTYYGISFSIGGLGLNIYLTQFIYGISEFPAKTFILVTLKKLGRRWNETGGLILTGLCLVGSMLTPRDMRLYQTAFGALGKMFMEAAFTVLYLYTTELYPTVIRQNGLGMNSFMARVGVSLSPMVILLEDVWVRLPSTVFTLLTFAAALLALLLPETGNMRLPETIEDVEQTRRVVSTSDDEPQA